MIGRSGNDILSGLGGNDALRGDAGADALGGGGADDMSIAARRQRAPCNSTRDLILDFQVGRDRIDLSAIDANTGRRGDQLRAVGQAAFTAPGQLHWNYAFVNGVEHTILEGNVNNNPVRTSASTPRPRRPAVRTASYSDRGRGAGRGGPASPTMISC